MDFELLCVSKNGIKIYWDPINSHASTHFADTSNLRELVIEVLEGKELKAENLEFEIDMGRVVGTCDVIEVDDSDDVVYAFRKNRKEQGYVPFVKSRKAKSDSYVSIAIEKLPDGKYILSSAWIGKWDDPPFPQQSRATKESVSYWNSHAFIWGSQEIVDNSVVTKKPW